MLSSAAKADLPVTCLAGFFLFSSVGLATGSGVHDDYDNCQ
ncbi:hypothetical protein CIT292_09248 [Citrobacter youngae ATCC 29220]|uniref:Uncharacterized protein n=1 Tax=Citrobacter youngae ATCC 29220 TaxID=500640 RepID=D4BEN5_9ENTR|nr:hypothetical protein CIT292_09248 [Citrobacter youngae ATCC 29220]